jgi:hypothetical protein
MYSATLSRLLVLLCLFVASSISSSSLTPNQKPLSETDYHNYLTQFHDLNSQVSTRMTQYNITMTIHMAIIATTLSSLSESVDVLLYHPLAFGDPLQDMNKETREKLVKSLYQFLNDTAIELTAEMEAGFPIITQHLDAIETESQNLDAFLETIEHEFMRLRDSFLQHDLMVDPPAVLEKRKSKNSATDISREREETIRCSIPPLLLTSRTD